MIRSRLRPALLTIGAASAILTTPALAQKLPDPDALAHSLMNTADTGFNASRGTVQSPFTTEDQSNFNLGLMFSPAKGLDLRADAWRVDVQEQMPGAAVMPEMLIPAAGLDMADTTFHADLFAAPSVKSTIGPGQQGNGLDLSASYVWESPRFGQFILSTKATYLYDSTVTDGVLDAARPVTESMLTPRGTELQSSLMLTWQAGQHSASAITHHFDSFEELGALNLEQFNELVGNLTTIDLQYGYNLKTGKQGEAVFSVGVRNLLDERPQPIQQGYRAPGAIEQTGRVAYGTIKYQF